MNTVKLYYKDPYQKEFDAVVTACETTKEGFRISLDQTAFYPEGGGQPADHGRIAGFEVFDVHEKDGVIFHSIRSDKKGQTLTEQLRPGTAVHGILDWERRFDHMQQHSGEHIVSGMLCSRFDCSNVGFHMGEDFVTIDYDKPITKEQIREIEAQANRYILENHEFVELWPDPEELKRISYRSKKELSGEVRITSFPGADCCACCGTHVKSSAEVGLVKLFSVHAFREGVRIEMMSGRRALQYLSDCYEQNILCSRAGSAKPLETGEAVEAMKQEIIRLKGRCVSLENSLFDKIADMLAGKESPVYFTEELEPDALRKLTVKIGTKAKGRILVLAGSGDTYSYAMLEEGGDLKEFVKQFNQALCGRGGGRGGYAQGSLNASREQIEAFLG